MTEIILNQIPPSVNHAYYFAKMRTGRIIKIKTKECKAFVEYVKQIVDNMKLTSSYPVWDCTPLEVNIFFQFTDNRKHDLDNYQKIMNDALTGLIWKDDNQIQKITSTKRIGKTAQVVIEIKPYLDMIQKELEV